MYGGWRQCRMMILWLDLWQFSMYPEIRGPKVRSEESTPPIWFKLAYIDTDSVVGDDRYVSTATIVVEYLCMHVLITHGMNVYLVIYSAVQCWVKNEYDQTIKTNNGVWCLLSVTISHTRAFATQGYYHLWKQTTVYVDVTQHFRTPKASDTPTRIVQFIMTYASASLSLCSFESWANCWALK